MYRDWKAYVKELAGNMQSVGNGIPDTWNAFRTLSMAGKADGVLDAKTKELIAIGISIANRCEGCIAFHVREAVRLGTTREEMLETVGVALYLGGGPASVYGTYVMEAFDQFSKG
ncbi:carboxymuconolactone decarboxylase family protein [Phaeovibrio sulfidiphilus]|uniref:Carboxymuconolactone decarboxylase family protein n=1 Tax=Phaeovibrio sulfidiphilus TaxID=1220600 RepID=A0A8J6YVQ2_9PROT|nr:carboxymuconolactone decarboxylase family protein [Phaeovibrio sulfidiphilus]MBE1237289.1 carboxymuconolactone decarboxylase family protein [Phaeovibrio sulfidiphilus]